MASKPKQPLDRQAPHGGGSAATASAMNADLLSRGGLRLKQLESEVAAARAEAKRAELELALSEAQAGNASRLEAWLRQDNLSDANQSSNLSASSSDRAAEAGRTVAPTRQPTATGETERARPNDWRVFERFATERLTARLATTPKTTSKSVLPHSSSITENPPRDAKPTQVSKPASVPKSIEGFKEEELEKQRELLRRNIVFSRMSGIATSALLHVVLLIILAVMTFRLPSDSAGMAFEAASITPTQETFEFTQEIAVDSPSEQPLEPEATPVDSMDISEELAMSTTMETADFGQLSSAQSQSLVSRAMSASASSLSSVTSNAQFFGAAANGNNFCYVIDGSGSMRGGAWEAAKLELLKSLNSLTESQRFYIIFYNRELSAISAPGEDAAASHALYATAENLAHARRWIDQLRIGIGAPPNKALALAIEKEPDAVYLLTDGVTSVDVAKFLREENRVTDLINGEQVRVPIHSIAFYSLEGQELLKRIAAENQGQFVYVPDPRKR